MAFYSILSKGKCISGTYSFSDSRSEEFLSYDQMTTSPFRYVFPVALSYITIDSSSENAFRYFLYTSNAVLYYAYSREELTQIMFDYISAYQHSSYEFSYILNGTCNYIIDGQRQTFVKDDCYFQSPYIVKCEDLTSDHSIVTLLLSPEFIKEIATDISQYKDYTFFHLLPEYQKSYYRSKVKSILDEIVSLFLYSDMPGFSSLLRGNFEKLFYLLGTNDFYTKVPMNREGHSFLFEQIIDFTKKSHVRIRRQDLEKAFNYSGDYINTLIKKYTNLTLTEFSNSYALQRAAWLLLNSEMTVAEICENLRFSDHTYFYKIFKSKYGMTPMEYRSVFQI